MDVSLFGIQLVVCSLFGVVTDVELFCILLFSNIIVLYRLERERERQEERIREREKEKEKSSKKREKERNRLKDEQSQIRGDQIKSIKNYL